MKGKGKPCEGEKRKGRGYCVREAERGREEDDAIGWKKKREEEERRGVGQRGGEKRMKEGEACERNGEGSGSFLKNERKRKRKGKREKVSGTLVPSI